MNPTFPDLFSGHASLYEAHRPTYPPELFGFLAEIVSSHDLAWDCATGNGQAAIDLAGYFDRVIATDASDRQLSAAPAHPRVDYLKARAEVTPLRDASVDLVTVALALHWFDVDRFYEEVRRVVRLGGVLACWTYSLQRVSPAVDAVLRRFYAEVLGPYWAPQIRHVDSGYQTLPFPFEGIDAPRFQIVRQWELERYLACVDTWSASQAYRRANGRDPRDEIGDELKAAWGIADAMREVTWDLNLLVGRLS
ncbi:class I SAM-dependent methyltransferase [Aquisphaera insulae]|uniref:class I SAM-dependent methyltransferase n=1 Tax=Aquisphaera insulae TaxID=2712864 RepID=UPI0013ED2EC6|nr:class I SAM-dependent methyltransferase [Aquisphaera insulae]